MNKQDFLAQLRERLLWMQSEELEKTVNFYSEMIDDRIEEGESEEEAVAALGSIDEIIDRTYKGVSLDDNTSASTASASEAQPKKFKIETWHIVVAAVTFPIWFPILMSVIGVLIGVVATLFSVGVSLIAVIISLFGASLVGTLKFLVEGNGVQGMFMLGGFLISIGLGILLFFAGMGIIKAAVKLIKKTFNWVKNLFKRKENSNENI